jgi:hypothetical protein
MMMTETRQATELFPLPCIKCGRLLGEFENPVDPSVVPCLCGVSYAKELLERHRRPGYYREWLAALACTCGRVEILSDTVQVHRHRCRRGGIGMLPNPKNN